MACWAHVQYITTHGPYQIGGLAWPGVVAALTSQAEASRGKTRQGAARQAKAKEGKARQYRKSKARRDRERRDQHSLPALMGGRRANSTLQKL